MKAEDMSRANYRRYFQVALMMVAVGLGLFLLSDIAFAANEPTGEVKKTSFLSWLIHVSGIIGLFILCLSIYFVAIVVKSFLELRMPVAAPPETVELAQKFIEEKNFKGLLTLLPEDGSYYSQVLHTGISDLRFGIDDAREKMERTADALTAKMERGISNLAVIGTLGPMIGLLGTLKGMIASFSVIAMSGVALDAAKVAEGISEALVLTFEGVMLSVPAIYFFSLFKNRITQINIETTAIADDHLRAVHRSMKGKPAGPEPSVT